MKAFRDLINEERDFLKITDRPKQIATNFEVLDSVLNGGLPRGSVTNIIAPYCENAFLAALNIAERILHKGLKVSVVLTDPDNSPKMLMRAMTGISANVAVTASGDYAETEKRNLETAIGFLAEDSCLNIHYAYSRSAYSIFRDFVTLSPADKPDLIIIDCDRLYSLCPKTRHKDELSERRRSHEDISRLAKALGCAVILCGGAYSATMSLMQKDASPGRIFSSVLSHRSWLEQSYDSLIIVHRRSFFRRIRESEADTVTLLCSEDCNGHSGPEIVTLIHHASERLTEP